MPISLGIGLGISMGGQANFAPNPADPTLALWLDASKISTLFTDAGGTTPVTTDGDAVKKWVGLVGGINAGLQGTEFGTYNTNVQNGKPGIRVGITGHSMLTDNFLAAAFASAITVYVALKQNAIGGAIQSMLGHTGADWYLGSNAFSGSTTEHNAISGSPGNAGNNGGNTASLNGILAWSGVSGVLSFTHGAANESIGCNGIRGGFPRGGAFPTSGGFGIGIIPGSGFGMDGWTLEILAYKAEHTVAQQNQNMGYLLSKWGVPDDSAKPFLACVGNSITAGPPGGTINYPRLITESLTTWRVSNWGIGGITTPQLQARQAPQIASFDSRHAKNIAALWEVGNDLDQNYTTRTARQAVDAYWAWCDSWRAGGWKVVAVTVLPRNYGADTAKTAAVAALYNTANGFILAEWASHADAVADPTAVVNLQDPTNATYYADLIHPTNAGYALVAPVIQAAVQTL